MWGLQSPSSGRGGHAKIVDAECTESTCILAAEYSWSVLQWSVFFFLPEAVQLGGTAEGHMFVHGQSVPLFEALQSVAVSTISVRA